MALSKLKHMVCALCALATLSFTLQAQEVLSLEQCLRLGVQNNIDISVSRHLPDIAQADVMLAESPYDLFVTGGYEYNKLDSRLLQEQTGIFSLGVSKRFITGTSLFLGYDLQYRRSSEFDDVREINAFIAQNFDPTFYDRASDIKKLWTSGITLKASQPLLRNFGFGRPNEALIQAAQKQKEIAEYEIERQVNASLAQIEIAYWTWIFTIKSKEQLARSVAKAKKYKEFVEPQSGRVGGVLPSDINDANVNIYNREDRVIAIEKEWRLAQDRLKRQVFAFNAQNPLQMDWDKEIVPAEAAKTEFEKIANVTANMSDAIKQRPEIRQLEAKKQSFALLVERSENQLLPAVDVNGGVTFLGEEQGGPGPAFSKNFNGDHYRWSVGVSVEIPLGNLAAKSERQRAQSQLAQTESELHKAQYDIMLEVREALHEVTAAQAKYAKSQATLDESEKSLASLERRYEKPLAGDLNFIFFLQDAEFKLTEAYLVQLQAMLDYKIAVVRLKLAESRYTQEYYKINKER
jgi:outer membrane protein TolC